jgi:hypothetical protein
VERTERLGSASLHAGGPAAVLRPLRARPLLVKSSAPAYSPALAPAAPLHASTLASPSAVSAHVDACAQRRQKVVEREEMLRR